MVEAKIVLVTGANRGIGLEVARQLAKAGFYVYMGSRSTHNVSPPKNAEAIELDVDDAKSIAACVKTIFAKHKRIDVLVNNAGIFSADDILDMSLKELSRVLQTNVFGALQLAQHVVPLMLKNNYGRVINVSSGMGQLSEMQRGYAAYRISKTALNAITRILAANTLNTDVQVNSVCPGWVRTDMGGKEAPRSLEEGADTIVWLAQHISPGPNGKFFRDRKEIPW